MIYKALGNATRDFRLLTVHAGEEQGDLRCSLETAQIDSGRSYETISYCWGHDIQPALLYLDGEALYVPANALAALYRLRLHDARRVLWIDSICINQRDIHERSRQVASMGSIYRGAVANLIFLGIGSPTQPPDLVEVLRNAAEMVKEARAELNQADEIALMAGIAPQSWRSGELISVQAYSTLIAVFESAWFRRLWVVQEAALARHNMCFLGSAEFALEDVLLLASVNLKPAQYQDSVAASFYAASNMRPFILQDPASSPPVTFRSYRLLVKNMETTDPRDRIFAVLELFRAAAKLTQIPALLEPNYGKTIGAVFRDATRFALGEANSNTLLATICHRSSEELTDKDFASWSLRWDRQYHPREDPMQLNWAAAGLPQSASANDRRLVVQEGDDPGCLRLKGYMIGTITWCTEVIDARCLNHEFSLHIVDAFLSRAEMVAHEQTFGVVDMFALTATTLTAGHLGDSNYRFENTHQRAVAFHQYLQYLRDNVSVPRPLLAGTPSPTGPEMFHKLFGIRAHQRRGFQLDTGHLGIGPCVLQLGDRLIVCKGAEHPYLLRRVEDGYRFVGAVYVSGLMAGQALHFGLQETWVDIR